MPASTVPLSWQANLAAMREQAQQMQKLGLQAQQLLSSLEQETQSATCQQSARPRPHHTSSQLVSAGMPCLHNIVDDNVQVEGDLQQLDVQQQRLSAQLHPELAELQAGQQVLDSLQQAELAKREAFLQGQDVLQEMSQSLPNITKISSILGTIGKSSGAMSLLQWQTCAALVQELRQKKKQLQAATDETGNKQTLQEMRDAVARLDGELADMSVHVGLLQHQVIHKYPTHNPLPTVTTM
ncbi:hypothetical protein MMC29_000005 [Sticta canariensis]|nr:hypothetical protein [Sticta canariensis]